MAGMKEKHFKELLESVKEVGLMEKGEVEPAREFLIKRQLPGNFSSLNTFAICLSADDEELIPLKIYHVIIQPKHKTCTVKDESGETVVCPIKWFLPIEFPAKIEKLLEKTELAMA
ncbi:MAG: hypothetical protein ACRD6X_11455 [Pyrinomonadaceae bacterium]